MKTLAEENVIHPGGRIDLDLDVVVRAAEMEHTVDDQVRRLAEFVIDDFEIFGVDPDDRLRQAQVAADVFEANFMVRKS
jgi:hypothetical protein